MKYRVTAPQEPGPQPVRPAPRPANKARIGHREALFRAVIVLVILGSVAVAYWSFFHRLIPLQRQAREMITAVSGRSAELDQMEHRWTPQQMKEIRARYLEVHQHLFADQPEFEQWLAQVQRQAAELDLEVNVGFGTGKPQETFSTNLFLIPASISLEVLPASGDAQGKSPYERVLAFGQQLAAYGKRADLAELTVNGGVGSVNSALFVFNLWAGDLGAEAAETFAAQYTSK